jgi:hypothetical protein
VPGVNSVSEVKFHTSLYSIAKSWFGSLPPAVPRLLVVSAFSGNLPPAGSDQNRPGKLVIRFL